MSFTWHLDRRDTVKVLVVYDSAYGNTELIAKAIGGAIGGESRVVRASEVNPDEIRTTDLLIIGSPTHGGRPTPAIQDFIDKAPGDAVNCVKVAAFDTRFSSRMVRVFGYAAERIAISIEAKGGKLVSPPEAFFVKGKKGPLREGELERAATWAKMISTNLSLKS